MSAMAMRKEDFDSPEIYYIWAEWDDHTRRWSATSDDVPGLILETDTWEELMKAIQDMVPVLLDLNDGIQGCRVPISVQANYGFLLSQAD